MTKLRIPKVEKRFRRNMKAVFKHLKGYPMQEGLGAFCVAPDCRTRPSSIYWEAISVQNVQRPPCELIIK